MSSATTTNDNNTSGSTEERLKKLMKEREEILRRDTTIHSQLDRIKELAQQEEECILEIEQRRLDAIMREHEELHPLVTETCPLCLEEMPITSVRSMVRFTCCGKGCCLNCNQNATLNNVYKCPMCRADFPDNERKAAKQLKSLAKKGHSFAQAEVGWNYLGGMKGYPLDVEEGVKMLELASEQHDTKALRFLGHTLYEGKLVPRDVQRGLSLTHEAADLGNVESRLYLGKLYVLGDGHTRDIPKAIHCYTLAYGYRHDNNAQAGAALHLGLYHFNNHGEYGKQLKMWEYYGEVLPILMQCKKQDSGDCYSSMLLSKHYLSVAAKKGLIQAYFPLALVLMDLCHVQTHGLDAPGHSAIPESMYLARKAVDSGESQATRWISSMQAFWSSSCSHCKATTGKDSAKLMCCVRCKSIWFCSKECQVANWKEGHKFDCGRAKRLDESFANEMIEHFVTNQLNSLGTTRLS